MLISFLLYAASLNPSADTIKHPIDIQLDKCLSQAHATIPRAECYNTAYKAWENDISTCEKKLLKKEKQKGTVVAAQKNWEKEKDARFKEIADKYNSMRGTMYVPIRIKLRMEVLRARALKLENQVKN